MSGAVWYGPAIPLPDASCWITVKFRDDLSPAEEKEVGVPVPVYAVVRSGWLRQTGLKYITRWQVLVDEEQ